MNSQLYVLIKDRTDFGYDKDAKNEFKKYCKAFFARVDKHLKEEHKVAESGYSFNAGGIAGNGDPRFAVMFENEVGVAVTLADLHGEFQIMIRIIAAINDHLGEDNQWFPSSFLMDPRNTAKLISKVAKQ